MQLQDMVVSKALAANLTGVRFLARVGPGMYLQLFATSKSFLTNCADVWFLSSMGSHMNN